MKTGVLDTYDTISSMAMMALNSVPFRFVHECPHAAVSKCRLVLECRRNSAASADLRVMECTNPMASVQAVTARFMDKLRNEVLTELSVCRIAISLVYTVGLGWYDVLRQDGGRATSLIVPL
jgi:hypothetical protein